MKKIPTKASQRTSVYIVAELCDVDVTKFVRTNARVVFKIGISSDPENRLIALNCSHNERELISEYEFDTRDEAQHAERLLHKMLWMFHKRLEWFTLTHSKLKIIDKVLVSLLRGSCHYHNKEWFVTPKLSIDEMLKNSRLDFNNPPIGYGKKFGDKAGRTKQAQN